MLLPPRTVRGKGRPNLNPVWIDLFCDSLINRRCLWSSSLDHQSKAGSVSILFAMAKFAISTELDSFSAFNGSQEVVPSFHSTSNCHPAVVFFFTRFL
jgi:hypothetical protein